MSREYYTNFQKRLDGLCKEKRWNHKRLAMELNLSEHTVNGYFKRGARLPADNILLQIAELFKVDKGYIRCDQESRRLVSATIGDMTGLSPEAADTLVDTKKNPKAAAVLEAILTNPLYAEFIEDAYS